MNTALLLIEPATASELNASVREVSLGLPTLAATTELAALLAGILRSGITVGLSGGLGVGKTEFVRQLVAQLRSQTARECVDVISPSFMLEAVYDLPAGPGLDAIHHWDLYRIAGGELPGELEEIIADTKLLKLIEWPERVPSLSRLLSLELMIAFSDPLPTETPPGAPQAIAAGIPISEGRICRIRVGERMHSKSCEFAIWNEFLVALKARLTR